MLQLGGGNSSIFYVHPEAWGNVFQFDYIIFFRWVGSTTNQTMFMSLLGELIYITFLGFKEVIPLRIQGFVLRKGSPLQSKDGIGTRKILF